jgi:hypothetical protein
MPLGSIPWTQRLGISNLQGINASSFANTVLHLPTNIPIYQGQLIHSRTWLHGPAKAAAEWCGTADDEASQTSTIREISAHDTFFARRNLSNTVRLPWESHCYIYANQIYYVDNEPEAAWSLSTGSSCDSDCWHPRDRLIDPHLAGYFPDPNNQFWESLSDPDSVVGCGSGVDHKRIRPEALAWVYMRLKQETEALGRGNLVLPPSGIEAFNDGGTGISPYWQTFFDKVHTGVTFGGIRLLISPTALRALHFHHYSLRPSTHPTMTPMDSIAFSATRIRVAADWYRNRYNNGNAIPVDILLSEMGLDWNIDDYTRWAGGWENFRDGLNWWNSWLRWLTRRAPFECNLQGWDIDVQAHTVHACIHEPTRQVYTTNDPPLDDRNQGFFHSDVWMEEIYYNAPVIRIVDLDVIT